MLTREEIFRKYKAYYEGKWKPTPKEFEEFRKEVEDHIEGTWRIMNEMVEFAPDLVLKMKKRHNLLVNIAEGLFKRKYPKVKAKVVVWRE